MTIVSDAPSCGVTYDCHSDDSRGIIYLHHMHRYWSLQNRLLKVCYVPANSADLNRFLFFFFSLRPSTVLMNQIRQGVCPINQSISLRCLWYYVIVQATEVHSFRKWKTTFEVSEISYPVLEYINDCSWLTHWCLSLIHIPIGSVLIQCHKTFFCGKMDRNKLPCLALASISMIGLLLHGLTF
jgi:hypothetical protein